MILYGRVKCWFHAFDRESSLVCVHLLASPASSCVVFTWKCGGHPVQVGLNTACEESSGGIESFFFSRRGMPVGTSASKRGEETCLKMGSFEYLQRRTVK